MTLLVKFCECIPIKNDKVSCVKVEVIYCNTQSSNTRIVMHWTTDNWRTVRKSELACCWDQLGRATFHPVLAEMSHFGRFQFAVGVEDYNGNWYWDNNDGKNYFGVFECQGCFRWRDYRQAVYFSGCGHGVCISCHCGLWANRCPHCSPP
jgi:hypothetical protein